MDADLFSKPTTLGFSVAITDLPRELGLMRPGAIYWFSAAQQADALALCKQILWSMAATSRAMVVSLDDVAATVADFPADQGPENIRFYRITGPARRSLAALPKDLARSGRSRNRLVLLMLPLDYFPDRQELMSSLLSLWQSWAERSGCTLLALAHGPQSASASARLLTLNHLLSGVARMEPYSGGYHYQIAYWRNALDASGVVEIPLHSTERGFKALAAKVRPIRLPTDEHRFFVEQMVLEGAPIFLTQHWQVTPDWERLFDLALSANAATVVFGLHDDASVPALARLLHILRKQRGPLLKLVVREMRHVLRGPDEQLLLACGANMVATPDMKLSRFLSLLENMQGQHYARELTDDPDVLLATRSMPKMRGMVSADVFIGYLDAAIPNMRIAPFRGVLLTLMPIPGLSAVRALAQADLCRWGDIACQINDVVYMFLFDCQPAFVEVALRRIFRLPFQQIFLERHIYSSALDVYAQNTLLKRQWVIAARSGTTSHLKNVIKSLSVNAATAGENTTREASNVFQPLLQALKLEG